METMTKQEAAASLRDAMKVLGGEARNVILEALGGAKPVERERVRASEPITVYAQKDILGPTGPGGKMEIVHRRGHEQQVPPVDAREIVRNGDYGYQHPGPEVEVAPVAQQITPLQANGPAAPGPGFTDPAPATPGAPAFALTSLPGVNPKLARMLEDAKGEDGVSLNLATLEGFRAVKPETLAQVPGVGTKMAEIMKQHVAETYGVKEA